jgi:endonuclease YncB( thermonuclease family)
VSCKSGNPQSLHRKNVMSPHRHDRHARRNAIGFVLPLALLLVVSSSGADPLKPADIGVIDAGTIEVRGRTIRLIDFDVPELGAGARCAIERMLAPRAASRLRQLIRSADDIDLKVVECSCPPGAEGTRACNYGRSCGYLAVDGRDVGDVLIAENLAHPYVCGRSSCPKPVPWCPFEPPGETKTP